MPEARGIEEHPSNQPGIIIQISEPALRGIGNNLERVLARILGAEHMPQARQTIIIEGEGHNRAVVLRNPQGQDIVPYTRREVGRPVTLEEMEAAKPLLQSIRDYELNRQEELARKKRQHIW